jgi:tRNA-Thr(GGU) m(6)t(6)A37 methyltransferase TsaA
MTSVVLEQAAELTGVREEATKVSPLLVENKEQPSLSARKTEVAGLCAHQRRAIAALEADVEAVDREIAAAEGFLAEGSNKVHALRGLVHMRSNSSATRNVGSAVVFAAPEPKTRRRDYRGKVQQSRANSLTACPQNVVGTESYPSDACATIEIVGTVYSEFSKRYEAPRQSFQGPAGTAVVSLNSSAIDSSLEALQSITPGCRIWVVYWFDRNAGFWREMVRPPRARGGWRIGLFATRSPHRPTPVGLSLGKVTSVEVDVARIHVKGVDVLDETPLVGWGVYRESADCHFHLKSGWLDDTDKLQPLYYDDVGTDDAGAEEFKVVLDDDVKAKIGFVDARTTIDVAGMLIRALSRMVRSPNGDLHTVDGRSERRTYPLPPHSGSKGECFSASSDLLMYPVGAWRVWYSWDDSSNTVCIREVSSGLRQEVIDNEGDVDREVREHRDFNEQFSQVHLW